MPAPMPVCESAGLIDLCGVGELLSNGWFTLQVSNLVWFLVLATLIVLAIAVPFPTRTVDFTGYEQPGSDGGGNEAEGGATTRAPLASPSREA